MKRTNKNFVRELIDIRVILGINIAIVLGVLLAFVGTTVNGARQAYDAGHDYTTTVFGEEIVWKYSEMSDYFEA